MSIFFVEFANVRHSYSYVFLHLNIKQWYEEEQILQILPMYSVVTNLETISTQISLCLVPCPFISFRPNSLTNLYTKIIGNYQNFM